MLGVSVLIPFHRVADVLNVRNNILRQDVLGCEYLILVNGGCSVGVNDFSIEGKEVRVEDIGEVSNIGRIRNIGLSLCSGRIIIHMDSDDWYSSRWIYLCLEEFLGSGAYLSGLSDCLYDVHGVRYTYKYKGSGSYVLGGTMTYLKSVALSMGGFKEGGIGEDVFFSKLFKPHIFRNMKDFVAVINGSNTCSHLSLSAMKKMV